MFKSKRSSKIIPFDGPASLTQVSRQPSAPSNNLIITPQVSSPKTVTDFFIYRLPDEKAPFAGFIQSIKNTHHLDNKEIAKKEEEAIKFLQNWLQETKKEIDKEGKDAVIDIDKYAISKSTYNKNTKTLTIDPLFVKPKIEINEDEKQKYVEYIKDRVIHYYALMNRIPDKTLEKELTVVEEIKGGSKKVTYKGRKYTVRVGERGGLYILVGADKKKVYLRK